MIRTIIGLACCFSLSACYYDVEEELYPGSNCGTPEQPTYTEHVKAVIDANCATSGCHVDGGTGPGNFTSYEAISGYLPDVIEARVISSMDMPPSTPLTTCDFQLIETWINNGAPE